MERVDVDPDGDIILAVANTLELRVSSCVMSLTSPVFKGMLGPHFAEGHALRGATLGIPKILSLPDDNAADMKLLCFALHLANRRLPDRIEPKELCSLAKLVDKYGCAEALSFTASVWFNGLIEESEKLLGWQRLEILLTAAYYLDNSFYFARITNALARRSRTRMYPENTESDLVTEFYGKLRAPLLLTTTDTQAVSIRTSERIALQELGNNIGLLVEDFADWSSAKHEHEDDRYNDCDYLQRLVQQYLRQLTAGSLWPRRARPHLLCDVLNRIDIFPFTPVPLPCFCELCSTYPTALDDLHSNLQTLKEQAKSVAAGVCLDCFKAGGKFDGECRIPHKIGECVAY